MITNTFLRLALPLLLAAGMVGCTAQAKRDRHLKRAEQFIAEKKFAAAELECLNVLRSDPRDLRALTNLQAIYYDQGNVRKLVPVLRAVESGDTNNLKVKLMMARVYVGMREMADARRRAKEILAREPQNLEAALVLAESSTSPEEFNELQQLVSKWPRQTSPNYHQIQAVLAVGQRNLPLAETNIQEALRLDPKSIGAQQLLAWIYWTRGDTQRSDALFKSALTGDVDQPYEQLRWAWLKIRIGDVEQARKILEGVMARRPEFLPAQTYLASIAFEQRRFEECEKLVAKIISEDRTIYTAQELQARLKLVKGSVDDAIKDLERLVSLFPSNPQAHFHLGLAKLQKQDLGAARESLARATALDPNLVEATLAVAEVDVQRGNAAAAVTALEQVLSQRPALHRGRIILAEAYRAQGALEKSVQEYRKVVRALPGNPQVQVMLGVTLQQQRKSAEARTAFETALKITPGFMPAIGQLVDLDLSISNYPAALQRTTELIARLPKSPDAYYLHARSQLASRQFEPAEASLNKIIEIEPRYLPAYDLLIGLYSTTKREKEALVKLDEVIKQQPKNLAARFQQALLHERLKQDKQAMAAYRQLLEINPEFIPALNNAAYLHVDRGGDLELALQYAQKAAQLDKENPAIQDTLGWVHFQRGDVLAAVELLRQASARLPEEPDSQYHYGLAAYAAGRLSEATAALRRALASPKEFAGRSEAQWRMEALGLAAQADAGSLSRLEALQKDHAKDPGTLLILGEAEERAGRREQARAAYQRLLDLNPNSVPALLKLATSLALEGRSPEQALKLARTAYPLAKSDGRAKHTLGIVAMNSGDPGWALRLFQEASETANSPDLAFDLALCHFWLGNASLAESTLRQALARPAELSRAAEARQFQEALALYRVPRLGERELGTLRGIASSRPGWPLVELLQAKAELSSGATNQALARYAELTRRHASFVPAALDYASLLTRGLREPEKALPLLEQSGKLTPLTPAASGLYGEALYLTGSYSNAVKALREGTRAEPLSPDTLFYLGLAYQRIGDKQQSKRTLQQALLTTPNHRLAPDAKEAIELIDSGGKFSGAKPF